MVWTPSGFDYVPVPNRYSADRVAEHFSPKGVPEPLGLVLHVQVGNNSPRGWFSDKGSQSSSTWWAGKNGGREQYVDPDRERAWAQGSGNWEYLSIETEGYPGDPMTDKQIESVAQALADGHTRYGWPLKVINKVGDRGLGWHGMGGPAWGNHPSCPGDKRKAQMAEIAQRAAEIARGKEEVPMAVTSNGWPVRDSYPAAFVAPNGHVCDVVSDDMSVVFAYVMWRLETEVDHLTGVFGSRTRQEQINLYRQKGLAPVLDSNHISGTAVDAFKPGVVYEREQRGRYRTGYTAGQVRKIRSICRSTGVVQWGGDFPRGVRDPGHYQLTQDFGNRFRRVVSSSELSSAAARIGKFVKGVQEAVGVKQDGIAGPGTIVAVKKFQRQHGLVADGIWGAKSKAAAGGKTPSKPKAPSKPKPKPKPKPSNDGRLRKGDRGAAVKRLQEGFLKVFPAYAGPIRKSGGADGVFGEGTEEVVKDFQQRVGIAKDGVVGPTTKGKLAHYGIHV